MPRHAPFKKSSRFGRLGTGWEPRALPGAPLVDGVHPDASSRRGERTKPPIPVHWKSQAPNPNAQKRGRRAETGTESNLTHIRDFGRAKKRRRSSKNN